jgi:hypothetical protein
MTCPDCIHKDPPWWAVALMATPILLLVAIELLRALFDKIFEWCEAFVDFGCCEIEKIYSRRCPTCKGTGEIKEEK